MESSESVEGKGGFLCGVVEGFYGRPWTTEQRKDLFQKMRKWGMDSYLYAPKDDYKHRAYWRELYTVEEADHLTSLISNAKDNNIRFIYAISPGLDIKYSNTKDVSTLKRKIEQVKQLGCEAFAILFDDIDTEMSKADKKIFESFAHAQVSVTNEVYEHINVSTFLFCPTQYCATRAMPTVSTSEYLKTIGSKLELAIDIMWTGPKVISKDISLESIHELTEVLRRPPVIWDNLHANDYDQKRLFLGPYAGRSPQLIPKLRGVLTNPNCEYGANFIAIHTLAQWSQCCVDAKKKLEESMNADVKLETESEYGNSGRIPDNLDPHVYHPSAALRRALTEWLGEFYKGRAVWGPIVKPQIVSVPIPLIPSVNTCISITSTTTTVQNPRPQMMSSVVPILPTVNCSARELTAIVENGSKQLIPSTSSTMMNSLVADNKILRADSSEVMAPICSILPPATDRSNFSDADITEPPSKEDKHFEFAQSSSASGMEPMDYNTATPPNRSPPLESTEREDIAMVEGSDRTSGMSSPYEGVTSGNASISVMNLDTDLGLVSSGTTSTTNTVTSSSSSTMQVEGQSEDLKSPVDDNELNVEDLNLLCDLFYLPFEHGSQGVQIMQEFQWLKTNSNIISRITSKDKSKPEVIEWYERATKFGDLTARVNKLSKKLNFITNRELLYEIYPYIWDLRGVISLLNSYIKWLASLPSYKEKRIFILYQPQWNEAEKGFSKGWREAFTSGDQEPWVIRGGLTAELQRLIPVDRGTDLYMYKAPDVPNSQVYTIRPYRLSDEDAVYKISLETFKDGLSAAKDFSDFPKLAGDLKVGGFLTMNPDVNFVVEDENDEVVGIAVAVLNGKEFRRKLNVSWLDMLRKMYTLPNKDPSPFVKDVLSSMQSDLKCVPDEIKNNYPAELRFSILTSLADPSVPKRLMTCVLAALRANGIFGCFVEIARNENYLRESFKKLGFTELDDTFMGRSF